MKKHIFAGAATAVITPFADGVRTVDFRAFDSLVRYQLANKADAIVVAGTTGEAPVLSAQEKTTLIKIAVSLAGKNIPIIAGAGSNNTQEAVKNANEAEKQGVSGLLIVTPYYNKCTQDGIIEHYFYIADRVSTPIIVYNVPSRTGVNIKSETYKILSEHKNICAVKEANGDLSQLAETIALCSGKADIYSGNDEQTVSVMANGGRGVISVAANIIPDVMHKLTELCLNNEFDKAAQLQAQYIKLMRVLFSEVNPIPVKYACKRLFGTSPLLRLPLTEITNKNAQALDLVLSELGLV